MHAGDRLQAVELDESAVLVDRKNPAARRSVGGREQADEQLRGVTIEEIEHDPVIRAGVDPGLVKDGVSTCRRYRRYQLLGEGYTGPPRVHDRDRTRRPACRDERGGSVAVEIKRRGEIDGVGS